jgi:hypothetical protein
MITDGNTDNEFELAPLDPEIDVVREMNVARYAPVDKPAESAEPKYQFGLIHILSATVFTAVSFAALEWFRAEVAAGILGLFTLICLLAVLILGRESPQLKMFWTVMLLVYASIAIYVLIEFVE